MSANERVFAILTVIPETDAAIRALFNLSERRSLRPRDYYIGQLPTTSGTVTIVTSRCDARSNIPACMAAAAFLQDWKPDCLLVVDIAGGVFRTSATPPPSAELVQLGDVVVHEKLIYYEFRKLTSNDERERSFPFQNPGPSLCHAALHVQRLESTAPWWNFIRVPRPPSASAQPKLIFGDILCGDKLLGDPDSTLVADLVAAYDKAIAVDMESVGVARAIHDMQPRLQKPVEFIAIRGISDYCNVAPTSADSNQTTREKWRRYAAEAAAAVALQVVREEGEVQTPGETLMRYKMALSTSLATLRAPDDRFELSIRDKKTHELEYASALDLVKLTGRAVLQGKAGAGKTAALNALAISAVDFGYLPVILNLRKLQPSDLAHVMAPDVALEVKVEALLATSLSPISCAMLTNLPEDTRVLFLADGVNELSGEAQIGWIFATLDAYADKRNAWVLVTDRPANTTLPTPWTIAILHGVKATFLNTLLEKAGQSGDVNEEERRLLQLPFYLNWAIEKGDFRLGGASVAHEGFFLEQLKLSTTDLDLLAHGALDSYRTAHSPEFDLVRFRRLVTKELTARLTAAGVIQLVDSATAQFDHQLRHDYLAARQLASGRDSWNAQSLDALTFEAASNQTLDLVVDQLHNEIDGDGFIRAVYDWNWRAATRCVSEAARHTPRVCSRELEVAITCLIAEKQFDPVAHTRDSSKAAMRGFRSGLGRDVADLTSREDVWAFPGTIASSTDWFNEWRKMFGGTATGDELLVAIGGSQSLVGWTAASVIRRSAAAEVLDGLLDAYERSLDANAVRWRVVHALGRFDEHRAVDLLTMAVLNDSDQWVRYGAGRSLIEIAATTSDSTRRQGIVTTLIEKMRELPDKVIEETARTVLFDGADATWPTVALALVDEAHLRVSNDLQKKNLLEVAVALKSRESGTDRS